MDDSKIMQAVAYENEGSGIRLYNYSTVKDTNCTSNRVHGIWVSGAYNTIKDNWCFRNGPVNQSGEMVPGELMSNCGDQYQHCSTAQDPLDWLREKGSGIHVALCGTNDSENPQTGTASDNRIEGNHVSVNIVGISVFGERNVLSRNTSVRNPSSAYTVNINANESGKWNYRYGNKCGNEDPFPNMIGVILCSYDGIVESGQQVGATIGGYIGRGQVRPIQTVWIFDHTNDTMARASTQDLTDTTWSNLHVP
ncbi:MAG: hypothetical protein KIS87_00825 [Phycisphaeraceae bacterium]|nr:hypothetical protein [Phycisphaeraceae bacterium]